MSARTSSQYQQLLREIVRATEEFESVSVEVREHWSLLKSLRTRLCAMRMSIRTWDCRLWVLAQEGQITAGARTAGIKKLKMHAKKLDDLFKQLKVVDE
jgi:hypothetical protein